MVDEHIPMFDGNSFSLTIDQTNLMYYCKFYNHHVYSVDEKDRPDEFTINNNVLLDNWLDRKSFADKNVTSSRPSTSKMNSVITFD